ncbi:hypothetical protein J2T16_002872 [Paenibacillus intestini]|nr:hypothetical protein [Paenibacillus intestini]
MGIILQDAETGEIPRTICLLTVGYAGSLLRSEVLVPA